MSERGSASSLSRRDFLKLLSAGGIAMAFAPFVQWGQYMPNPQANKLERAKVILPDGTHANINTYPVDHAEVITYPSTGDVILDQEAFRKWQIIRLPKELGGETNDVSAFRVYSNICVHLWCLWKYWDEPGRKGMECPCHGSIYDVSTGKAIRGPASVQAAPSNVLPMLDLESDSSGYLYIVPPVWDTSKNGIVGYGRFVKN